MEYTSEQLAVVNSNARRLAVQAGAGATKTTTLVAYAQARPDARILYLAFNKPVQLEAEGRMPRNVVCRTTHSVAFRKALQLFTNRRTGLDAIKEKLGNTYPSTLVRAFRCSPLAATAALQTIQAWCGSLEREIGPVHVPAELAARLADPLAVVELARETFARMLNPAVPEMKLPHDGYLKLFQMDGPDLGPYSHILVDESQDLNLCTFDIVRRQSRSSIVMVGDQSQQIYMFRGSANALLLFDATERLCLTRSFRFGRGIAGLANALLGHFKNPAPPLIIGAGEPQQTRFTINVGKQFAVIARSNAAVFAEAVGFLQTKRRYHFVGGVDGYKLEKVLDAYYLWVGDTGLVKDVYLRSFLSFDDLAILAEDSEDPELKHLVRVVEEYGHRIPGLVDEIRSRHVEGMKKEDWASFDGIFFGTAHKMKGLEFDQVWLADDFMRFFKDGMEIEPEDVSQEEVHILYVALTRARAAIRVCETFEEWLNHKGLMPT